MMSNLDLLLGIRSHIGIGSPVSGRLKTGLVALADPKAVEYVRVNGFGPPRGEFFPGVKRTRFNPLPRSMAMEYDRIVIEPELPHRLFSGGSDEEFEASANRLADACDIDLTVCRQ
ncbi:hypothetical protein [Desulfovibrio sp. Huiquan2017]|uniref:hypothetical protein n=1 Tax=Desulfovibrio sp. Huiquan2017 TaxID=2816861 RepID=UPI001A90D387|nr:hypothetical protein [Desulfovibrio sp. Huiquan2017]